MSLLFKKTIHLLNPYLLIRYYTDRNGVNELNTHTKDSEKDNTGKG